MNEFRVIENIESVLSGATQLPTIVMWNRLEGRPRRRDFSRALRAEVRDPLWMLARQLQMGEFKGDDAGSPVTAKVRYSSDRITHIQPRRGAVSEYDRERAPLEPVAEAMPAPLVVGGLPFALDQRLAMGRRWVKLLQGAGLGALEPSFRTAYGFGEPDPDDEAQFPITAHASAWQSFAAVAGRAVDGGELYLHLSGPGHLASDGLGLSQRDKTTVDTLGGQFVDWVAASYEQPGAPADSAWNPRQLEYQLALSAPRAGERRTLIADEYHGGALDWYAFDVAAEPSDEFPAPDPGQRTTVVTSFVPTGVQFDGMPNTRWWAFEEGKTNFGDIRPDTTDLSKLLLIEFGIVYANDWFLLPIELNVGSATDIEGLAVTNVFGERFWIEPAVSGPDESWRRWGMFNIASRPAGRPDGCLLLPSGAPEALDGPPVEAVSLIRDEVSNMVWGIETGVQLADGGSRPGREVAHELHGRFQRARDAELAANPPPPDPHPNDATSRYELMSTVAENWIPFTPMHLEGDNREVQLQRAAMPRLLKGVQGVDPDKIRPRTVLLREGLDDPTPDAYFVAEEEVARAGEYLTRRWRRVRWRDGRVFTWLGVHRRTGRGEGSSGLAFDGMVPKPKE